MHGYMEHTQRDKLICLQSTEETTWDEPVSMAHLVVNVGREIQLR